MGIRIVLSGSELFVGIRIGFFLSKTLSESDQCTRIHKSQFLLQGQHDHQVRERLRHEGDDPADLRPLRRCEHRQEADQETETGTGNQRFGNGNRKQETRETRETDPAVIDLNPDSTLQNYRILIRSSNK